MSRFQAPAFHPLPFLNTGWRQTLAGRFLPQYRDLAPHRELMVSLPDGDRLVIAENRPQDWSAGDPVAILLHGLTGCCQSRYMTRLSRKLVARGYCTWRVNLRTCGLGFGHARQIYHSGRSEDARAVVLEAARLLPGSLVSLIGFSLGANIVLKMAGEDGAQPSGHLTQVVAVSAPIDLARSAVKLARPENRLFDRHFVSQLRSDIARLHQHFPDITAPSLPERDISLTEFDDYYTAPRGGFKDAQDYYRQASSRRLIPQIRVPSLLLSSLDDPVVDGESYLALREESRSLSHLSFVITHHGGHVGFVGHGYRGTLRWMDALILAWLNKHASHK